MDHLEFSRNDGLYTPLNVTDDGVAVDMSAMTFKGVIEWFDGSIEISEAAGTLVENDASQGMWYIDLSDADAEAISKSTAAFLTMRDETPGSEYTYIERLAVKVL